MSEIKYIKGSAVEPIGKGKKHIIHICNDKGYWGAGFVMAISGKWDAPKREYKQWQKDLFFDPPFELGNIQNVNVEKDICVVNMIAQEGVFWGTKPPIRYNAVESCLEKVVLLKPKSVHLPRIGCGLAGGEWGKIEKLINKTLVAANIPVFVYDLA